MGALQQLQSLELRGCGQITDAGLQHISRLQLLQALDLHSCDKITDAGLQHLVTLPELKRLNLDRCPKVTDAGLQHLTALHGLTLHLHNCDKITNAGLAAFFAAQHGKAHQNAEDSSAAGASPSAPSVLPTPFVSPGAALSVTVSPVFTAPAQLAVAVPARAAERDDQKQVE